MLVLKFGGSSIGNVERINNVIDILKSYIGKGKKFAVIFSAFQGVTDKLITLVDKASIRDDSYEEDLTELIYKHISFLNDLNSGIDLTVSEKKVSELLDKLAQIVKGIYLVREATPRTRDIIMSFGERLSCTIISETMNNRGIECEFLDSSAVIVTDENHGLANVNFEETNKRILDFFNNHNKLQIVTGFIASSQSGQITTLGRGGSDYSASIFGAALDAEEIQIWTDVNGILSADPHKVTTAVPKRALTYEEAMELSYFGARVIHFPTIYPALNKKIKLRIKNTFDPSFRGTLILEREENVKFNAKGISSIDDISLIRVNGGGVWNNNFIARRIFELLNSLKVSVHLTVQNSSGLSICLALLPKDAIKAKAALEEEFKHELDDKNIKNIKLEEGLSLITVVGEDLVNAPDVIGKVFLTLGENNVGVHAIGQGSSDLNISFIIKKDNLSKSINLLHDALFAGDVVKAV